MTTLNKLIENKSKKFDQLIYKELLNYGYEAFIVLVKDFLSQSIQSGYELAIREFNQIVEKAKDKDFGTYDYDQIATEFIVKLQSLLKGEK